MPSLPGSPFSDESDDHFLSSNLHFARELISDSCFRSQRDKAGVRLVAVTKYAEIDQVHALYRLGERHFGESRPQQLIERAETLSNDICWHLIGRLQRNKVRAVLPYAQWIHSVDSVRLLERIDEMAGELGVRPNLLLQANVSGEEAKQGFEGQELLELRDTFPVYEHVDIAGLMTMAPNTDDFTIIRQTFSDLRQLRDQLRTDRIPLPHLSMGMSRDFEVAVEEGATIVRLGSAVFQGWD